MLSYPTDLVLNLYDRDTLRKYKELHAEFALHVSSTAMYVPGKHKFMRSISGELLLLLPILSENPHNHYFTGRKIIWIYRNFMFELTISWEEKTLDKRDHSWIKTQLKQFIAEQKSPLCVWYDIYHDDIVESLYAIHGTWQCFFFQTLVDVPFNVIPEINNNCRIFAC